MRCCRSPCVRAIGTSRSAVTTSDWLAVSYWTPPTRQVSASCRWSPRGELAHLATKNRPNNRTTIPQMLRMLRMDGGGAYSKILRPHPTNHSSSEGIFHTIRPITTPQKESSTLARPLHPRRPLPHPLPHQPEGDYYNLLLPHPQMIPIRALFMG
jgi:hypothetical protein